MESEKRHKRPFPDPRRRKNAKERRKKATHLSTAVPHPEIPDVLDEKEPFLFSFTKGLSHGRNGLLKNPKDFDDFKTGTEQHDPKFFGRATLFSGDYETKTPDDFKKPLCYKNKGAILREWESPTSGHAYVLEGPDPFALTMPLAPRVGSNEFVAEIAEVYQMALSRDCPVAAFMAPALIDGLSAVKGQAVTTAVKSKLKKECNVADAAARLSEFNWFKGNCNQFDTNSGEEQERRRFGKEQTVSNLFRGAGEDPWDTPFLSQFMVMGNEECTKNEDEKQKLTSRAEGLIGFGAQTIDQKVRVAFPGVDYMMRWEEWLDVQNALNIRVLTEEFVPGERRFISYLRDLATYVHDDQLYQAYFNAMLIMLGEKYPFDPGIPYHGKTENPAPAGNRDPFALFGAPHLLTLLPEVASRALKAVRIQKFSIHRRLRPEAAGALFHTVFTKYQPDKSGEPYSEVEGTIEAKARSQLSSRVEPYVDPENKNNPQGTEPKMDEILKDVREHNKGKVKHDTWLLPMAFPEGSPMHPAYGAGHATVAGACVTMLKAFFNMRDPKTCGPAYLVKPGEKALVPSPGSGPNDTNIDLLGTKIENGLTLEGELNKLMWNISNARNIAGVHYYTDYIESALLGEAITLGILREQMVAYNKYENVTMTVPLLIPRTLPETLLNGPDGKPGPIRKDEMVSEVKICSNGTLLAMSGDAIG